MKLSAQNFVLGFGAMLCFLDSFVARGDDPGPAITAVMGILLVRRAIIITPQPVVVIFAGCFMAGLFVASNHGIINGNRPIWIALFVVSAVCYGLWERIEKLWK